VTLNLVDKVAVLVIMVPGEKGSGLRPSEIELPEWCSGAFHHRNTPVYMNI
jgi:hypothetical protein